jgi:hypothetical protein
MEKYNMTLLQQKDTYGCGLYSVANALCLENFVTLERLEKSKTGNNVGMLTKWLNDDGHDIFIDTIKFTGRLIVLPQIGWILGDNVAYYPMLITIPSTRETSHMIALKGGPDGTVDVWDSLKNAPYNLENWKELKKHFPKVYGIYGFRNFENKEVFMCYE